MSQALTAIGWPPEQALSTLPGRQRLARVTEQHRNGFVVHDGHERLRAQAPRGQVDDDNGDKVRPAVGDWVVVEGTAEPLSLVRMLPRRTLLKRAAAGERFREQILASNVDLAIVVMGLDGDYNPRRLERYLALTGSAGVATLVVLSKVDRCEDAADRLAEIRSLAEEHTVLAINCKDPVAVQAISQRLGPGRTGVLLGSSGAGKSTLSNTLMGTVKQKTGDVRAHDQRGRHTTTVRSLLQLPAGGCLIDSPGMRELKLTGEESLEAEQFADVEQLASQCRFRDCRHESEPGCAVQAAIASGGLDAGRYAHFRKLADERDGALAQRAAAERKAEDKVPNRALNPRPTEKHGRR